MVQRLHLEWVNGTCAFTRPQGHHTPSPAIAIIILGFHQPPTDEPTPWRDKPKPEQRPSGVGFLSMSGPFLVSLTRAGAFCVRAKI